MNTTIQARLDKGIRSLDKEFARKGMFENAGRKQRGEFRDWIDRAEGVSYPEKAAALAAFDDAVELAHDRFIAARNRKA